MNLYTEMKLEKTKLNDFFSWKNKKSFWDSSFKLISDKGRKIISNPELSKKLIEEVRKQRKNRVND